jgi:hypothetical protein
VGFHPGGRVPEFRCELDQEDTLGVGFFSGEFELGRLRRCIGRPVARLDRRRGGLGIESLPEARINTIDLRGWAEVLRRYLHRVSAHPLELWPRELSNPALSS